MIPIRMSNRVGLGGNGRAGVQVKSKRHHKIVLENCKSTEARCLHVACVHSRLLEGCKGTGTREFHEA
eukprot:1149834-Pelagomonas_calceolata.AAC.9